MAIETLEDIIEELADRTGVYGACPNESASDRRVECPGECRCCFVANTADRIREAVRVENALKKESP